MLKETKVGNWRTDKCTVYIGRGSIWGNRYVRIGKAKYSKYPVIEVKDPIAAYEEEIRNNQELISKLPDLAGEILGCFCVSLDDSSIQDELLRDSKKACHGFVLVKLIKEFCLKEK